MQARISTTTSHGRLVRLSPALGPQEQGCMTTMAKQSTWIFPDFIDTVFLLEMVLDSLCADEDTDASMLLISR